MFAQSARKSNNPVRSKKTRGRAKSKPKTVVSSSAHSKKRHPRPRVSKTKPSVPSIYGGTDYHPLQNHRASSAPPRKRVTLRKKIRLKSKSTRATKRSSSNVAVQRRRPRSPAIFSSVSSTTTATATTASPPCPSTDVPSLLSSTTGVQFFRDIIETTFGTAPGSPRKALLHEDSKKLKLNKKLNPRVRVRKLKKGKKSKRTSSDSSSDKGDKDHLLLQSCDDSFILELLSSGDSPSKNQSKNMMMMTTSAAGAAEARRHPLSKLSNVSPFTPQPQKAPTPMAGVALIPRIPQMASFPTIQLDYKSDPFVVHNIDPMEIQREDDDEEKEEKDEDDEDDEEEDFVDCVDDMDDMNDVENNQVVVPSVGATVSAQAQYIHFIKTVLSKRRPTNNTIQSKDTCKKHPTCCSKGKRKLTKATKSVIERMKNQAWEKLQREKRNKENRPVQCATTVGDISSV